MARLGAQPDQNDHSESDTIGRCPTFNRGPLRWLSAERLDDELALLRECAANRGIEALVAVQLLAARASCARSLFVRRAWPPIRRR